MRCFGRPPKIGWDGSRLPSARSILEIVAHSGHALHNIAQQLRGIPFSAPNSTVANGAFLDHDAQFSTADEVAAYLEEQCAAYIQLLESFTQEDLDRRVRLPFGLGKAPIGFFMTMGHIHTLGHVAQIEYVQTLYGDQLWHTGF